MGRARQECKGPASAGLGLDRGGLHWGNKQLYTMTSGVSNSYKGTWSSISHHLVCSLLFVCLSVVRPSQGSGPCPHHLHVGGTHRASEQEGLERRLLALCPLLSGWGASTVSLSLSLSLPSSRSGIFNTTTGTGVGVGEPAGAQAENRRPAGI